MTSPASDDSAQLFCPQCSYDLRAINSPRCPECGHTLDRETLAVSRIPWVHRQDIGRIKAFLRTTATIIFRPKKLAQEMALPANLPAARAYRRTVVWLTILPFIPILSVLCYHLAYNTYDHILPLGIFPWTGFPLTSEILLFSLTWAAFITLLSGSHLFFFHPKRMPPELQTRAVALAHYACAPLILITPAILFAIGARFLIDAIDQYNLPFWWAVTLGIIAFVGIPLLIAFRIISLFIFLLRQTTHASLTRLLLSTLFLPLTWLTCALLSLLIPTTALLFELVRQSFL